MFDMKNVTTKRASLLFVSLVAVAAFTVGMIHAKAKIFSPPTFAAIPSDNSTAIQADEKLESELITVNRFGFMPLSITRPAKGFALIVDNHTADPDLNLRLNRLLGNVPADKLLDLNLKRGRGNWYSQVNLPPGEYELSEANHPEWKCKITLTPR